MATSSNIRAGGASVEIVADPRKLDSGLREAEAKLRAYNQRVRQLNREATAAAKAGDQGQAIRLGMTARELDKHSDRVRERASTLSQGDDARSALAQRLASFRAGKAALLADQADLEDRLAAATMKPRDLALRDLDRHFAQMRAKYAGNAAMLTQIEQTAAAERAKVNADYSTGIMGMLGGKRLAKQEIKYAAANLAGVAGGEVGMAAMTLVSGAGAAAAVVAPLILLGVAFKGAAEAVDAVKASVKAWGEQLDRTTGLVAGANRLMGRQSPTEAIDAEVARITEEQRKVHDTDTSMSWAKRIFVGNAPQEWAQGEKDRQLDMLERSKRELREYAAAVKAADREWEKLSYDIEQASEREAAMSELSRELVEGAQELSRQQAAHVQELDQSLTSATNAALTGGVAGQREQEWQDMARAMEELGVAEEEVQRIRAKLTQRNAAQDNRAIIDQIDELNLKLAVAVGKMTELDAARARLAKEHPDADRKNIDKLVALQNKTNLAEWAKGEVDSAKTPAERFKDYRDKLDKAVAAGVLDQSKMNVLLQAKMAEMMGGVRNVGGFNVAAINQMVGGGSVAERTARACEETARNSRRFTSFGEASFG